MANPCSCIEMEPRTLNEGQLTHAREVAVDIVQKKEPNEASTIFMEGLSPVKEVLQIDQKGDSTSHCVCTTGIMESPDQVKPKEPVSAPF